MKLLSSYYLTHDLPWTFHTVSEYTSMNTVGQYNVFTYTSSVTNAITYKDLLGGSIETLVVGGGGAGGSAGSWGGGGGGAGGMIETSVYVSGTDQLHVTVGRGGLSSNGGNSKIQSASSDCWWKHWEGVWGVGI